MPERKEKSKGLVLKKKGLRAIILCLSQIIKVLHYQSIKLNN